MIKIIKKEILYFFTALMFFTRIPCPSYINHDADPLNKSSRYFPLIGFIVACISFIVFCVSYFLCKSVYISVLVSMLASVLTTGAFHEDGLADFVDGFGGGWTKDKILEIMKDSRSGAYGIVSIVFVLVFKYLLLVELINIFNLYTYNKFYLLVFLVYACAHILSRFSAVYIIRTSVYAREDASSKVKPIATEMSNVSFLISAILPLFFLVMLCTQIQWYLVLTILLILFVVTTYFKMYFYKWLKGYTGDCLGAIQQITEIVFYFLFLVCFRLY